MKERRTAVVKPLAVVLAALAIAASTALGQWNLSLSCETYPSPEVSDWERSPGIVRITISHTTRDSAKYELQGKITSRELGEIVTGRSDTGRMNGAQTVQRDNRDFMSFKNLSYNEKYRSQIVRTNRLMEGSYTLNLQLVVYDGARAKVVQERSANFYILSFRRATLVTPADSEEVATQFPTFQWTPATTHAGFTVNYDLKLVVLQKGQTPAQAINNLPHHTARVTNRTTYNYPNTARPLDSGKVYVWQVQARDGNGRTLGDGEGRSNLRLFFASKTPKPEGLLPLIGAPPTLKCTSSYVRVGSYYKVTFKVKIPAGLTVENLTVKVGNSGFQVAPTTAGELGTVSTSTNKALRTSYRKVYSGPSGGTSAVTKTFYYNVVPIVASPWPSYVVCDSVTVTFTKDGTSYTQKPSPTNVKRTVSDVKTTALKQVKHVTMTCPEKLFDAFDAAAVRDLLGLVGYLATLRNGAVLHVDKTCTKETIRSRLSHSGTWGSALASNWGEPAGTLSPGGYLFIIGESSVIPDWTITVAPPIVWSDGSSTSSVSGSDYNYVDVDNDWAPELAVGRAIGNTVSVLSKQVSTAYSATQSSGSYNAFLYAGVDKDDAATQEVFELAVAIGAEAVISYGSGARKLLLYEVTESKRAARVRDSMVGRSVVLYNGHGTSYGWDGLQATDVSSLTYSSSYPARVFVGHACQSGRYWASPYFGRSLMGKDGVRALIAATEDAGVAQNYGRTNLEFWVGYSEGNQSPGNAMFFLDYLHTVTAPIYLVDPCEKLALLEYNLYGDPW